MGGFGIWQGHKLMESLDHGNGNHRMIPLDFEKDMAPKNPTLTAAVDAYCEKEFGARLDYRIYQRTWAILRVMESDPDYFEVMGVTCVRQCLDCPIFHITPLTADKEGLRFAEEARDMAVMRMYNYLEDWGMRGTNILIFVSEKAQRYWKGFLSRIKAVPANRYELHI